MKTVPHLSVVLIVAASAVGAACSSPSDATADGATPLLDLRPSDDGVTFDADGATVSAEANGASKDQLELFEDGLLTFPEYESALLATFGCAKDAGVSVVELGVEQGRDGYPRVEYAVPVKSGDLSEADTLSAFDDCYTTHGESADIMWQLGHSTNTQPEEFDKKLVVLGQCLDANGVPTAEGSITSENLSEAIDAADRVAESNGPNCMEEAGLV